MQAVLGITHAYTWPIMIVCFVFALIWQKQRIWRMILRLTYIVMIVSGAILLGYTHFPPMLMLKGILAILLIGLMEMLLARRDKHKSLALFSLLAALVLALILLIGYRVL
ncbi:MAG: DUF1516 family protein [Sporolactobacillus sp.]